MIDIGRWHFTCDKKATAAAYLSSAIADRYACDCTGCRNFELVKSDVFPASFITFLDDLGVDPSNYGEVYHICRESGGKHCYGGWFHFVGEFIEENGVPTVSFSEDFKVSLARGESPSIGSLVGLPLVQIDFTAKSVPWRLKEDELG